VISIANLLFAIENEHDGQLLEASAGISFSVGFLAVRVCAVRGLWLAILDEAITGFLAVYNPTVTILRERWEWFPMPTYDFRGWLTG